MKAHRFALVIAFFAVFTSAQDCVPDGYESLVNVREAVRHMTKGEMYTGSDDKSVSRSGDMAAVAILQTLTDVEMTTPKTTQMILRVLRTAFACPSKCVTDETNRQPRVTLLLLDQLHSSGRGQLQSDIVQTKEFILKQMRTVQ